MPLTHDEAVDLMPDFITSCPHFNYCNGEPKAYFTCGATIKTGGFHIEISSCQNCPLERKEISDNK